MVTFAILVSRLLDPMWVMTLVTILGAYRYDLHTFLLWRIIVIVLLFMTLPQLLLRLIFSRHRAFSGWDIKDRKHRPMVISLLMLFGLFNIFLVRRFGNEQLGNLFIFYELWLLGFFLISLVWKMSGHAGGIALATGLIILWYGWSFWPILLLVPLMGWARIVTKDHTMGQVIGGFLYSWILVLVYRFFV